MKAVETLLNTFLSQNKTQFVIPVYQRNYDWSEAECRQLLNDVLDVGSRNNSTHFIGSIVYIHEGVYTSSDVKQLVIIDGQQRLTTFTLLYLALYRYALSNKLTEKANEIYETFIQNKFVKDDSGKLKLKQSDANTKAFHYLITNNDPAEFTEYSNLIQNFKFYYERITADNFDTLLNGIGRLLFVEISLERHKDDPQRIFESLNSTGLELSQADLIRNYILMDLNPEEQIRVFNVYWSIIEQNTREYEINESRVSDFIRDFLTFKNKRIPVKSKVYEEFKNKYSSRDAIFYISSLQELKEYSFYYRNLLNPLDENDLEIRKELHYINQLEINVAYPFLLPVYNDYKLKKLTKEEFIRILKLIQSYVWRRFIAELPTNALSKVFMYLYNDIDESYYVDSIERSLVRKRGAHRFPNNKEIENELAKRDVYNIKAKNRMYLFELLENYNNREFVSVNNPDITVEHIFPQTPHEKWRTDLDQSEFTQFAEKHLNTIANLTLSGNNGSLGNKSFSEKKVLNTDGKEQGYSFSRLWLNQHLKEINEWNIQKLNERFAIILDRFYKIWSYPEIEIDDEIDTDEDFTIYNAPDPRFKKLDYFIFRDEKIETSEVSKMYYHVIKTLFNENPSIFYRSEIKTLLGLSSSPSSLRSAYPLNDNLYIESNIDNNNKFRRLKELLTKLDLQEELLINYSELEAGQSEDELMDRSFWASKIDSGVMKIVDDCFQLLKMIDPDLNLNYAQRYVGISKDNKIENFVIFIPASDFVRVAIKVGNHEKWISKVHENNCKFISVGKKSGRIKFRIDQENLTANEEFLLDIMKEAYISWEF